MPFTDRFDDAVMYRRAALPGPANLVVVALIVAAVVGLALVGVVAGAAGAAPTERGTSIRVERGVVWRSVDGQHLTLDAFVASRVSERRPAVVLIHGGGWSSGTSTSLDPEAQRLAALGYDAFSIDYRLAPAHPFPAAVDDVQAAVQWLREPAQVQRFGLDPARIAALGSSAGAHLAAMLATLGDGSRAAGARVRAAVSWSGPMDFVDFPAGSLTAEQQAAVRTAIGPFLGCLPQACPATAAAASPITYVDRSDAPMLLVNSDAELVPLDQARRMAAALQQAGVAEQLVVLHGHAHAAAYAAQVWGQTVAFLEQYLGAPRP